MRNRLVKARSHSNYSHKSDFSIHQDERRSRFSAHAALSLPFPVAKPQQPTKAARYQLHDRHSPRPTLTIVSEGTINAAVMSRTTTTANGVNGSNKAPPPPPPTNSAAMTTTPGRMNSTIRAVMSFDERQHSHRSSEDSSTDGTTHSLSNTSRNSALSSSLNSNASLSSVSQHQGQTHNSRGNRQQQQQQQQQQSSQQAQSASATRSSVDIPIRESSLSATSPPMPRNTSAEPPGGGGGGWAGSNAEVSLSNGEAHLANGGWDSTVGKAGLGKTGRVINRLVSDNEALKRDIQIERLRAEESKQTARLLEDKLDRVVSEYESRLLEANVTKSLLARKERQVESLQGTVELERKRAQDAGQRERTWKDEMEKIRGEAKQQVEEATNYAALMEGRYNAISSHWRDQGEEVRRVVGKMEKEAVSLRDDRRKDDDRINTLQDLCRQQDGNIRELTRQKDEIAVQFERYKEAQEEALREIKSKAALREEEQTRMLKEAKEVLDKLKWMMKVKENVGWAQ
ncbi:hypothetical protein B0T17DRAFT_495192 [Bombardia bombarda]|uniref:SWI5-dependent HO expression protein 3 n=1 Tax=Bombardia bombarda TaxID=252184 RepID=A0AA39WM58_9PEZI|nr:hypothetical protein B0T17DRAFT_495192 [Bombardia bombarda]